MAALTYGQLPVAIDPTAWTGRVFIPAEDVGSIQAAIAVQLTACFTGAGLAIPVYVFPDFDLDAWWQSSAIAFVLISYHGTRFGRPMTTDAMVQERTLAFDLHVEARQTAWALTGAGSVYALVDAVEAALTGFRAPACRNAYFAEERFAEQDAEGRVWLYDMRLEVPTLKLKTEPAMALANLVRAQMYVAALAVANGQAVTTASYTFGGGTLTLPGPVPLVVGGIASANGLPLYQEFADWECDGTTAIVTATPGGAIGASDTVMIAWAPADVVVSG
ncbi:MAG: Gp37 family protein [Acetobacteraceae bacterium]